MTASEAFNRACREHAVALLADMAASLARLASAGLPPPRAVTTDQAWTWVRAWRDIGRAAAGF